ncbi:DUF333 domain-containing protein [Paracoccus siganidrum]|uniref:DUF333 domain-containing protein n=1 Tax=Paracoccus siganidrum TaxID=1276757 RepID=A0A419A8M0_9RHOB|nr:DUF333 domain-containing protein [Paracoccus siganidrum]RJL18332.1 DUF333 domain-containing protein [Paracoccus siganidrum]RMC31496.1 DUF333 domain-containing protein [Paracoccus siganidrum]
MRTVLLFAPLIAVAACGVTVPRFTQTPEERALSMPNPASAHCVRLGGRVEIQSESGGQVGYCHLPDGRVIEEWLLFRASESGTGQAG